MSKDKISDYSSTANSNTDIAGINIDEGCAPSGINDAIRTLMAQLKTWQSGGQDVYIHPAGSASAPSITANGDTNTGLFFPAADTVGIATGGTERARVDSSGNLGLGVTPSSWNSIFRTQQIGLGGFIAGRTDSRTQLQLGANAYYDSTDSRWEYIGTGEATRYYQSSGAHYWDIAASGTANAAISFTQAMTLDASGNLGVGQTSITPINSGKSSEVANLGAAGTTADNQDFVVRSTSRFASVAIIGNNTKGSNIYFGDGDSNTVGAIQYDHTSNYLSTTVNGAERARINSSGSLLVGTTTSTGTYKIETADNIKAGTGFVTGSGGGVGIGADSTNNTFYTSSLGSGSTTMYIGNKSINTTSDIRIKANVKPTERNALALLNQWEIVDHTWNDPSDTAPVNRNSRGVWTGVIAQQIINSTPWLVNAPDKDCPKCSAGEHCDEHDSWWQVDFEYAVPLLVKAIQEQQAIIETLTARITALEQA